MPQLSGSSRLALGTGTAGDQAKKNAGSMHEGCVWLACVACCGMSEIQQHRTCVCHATEVLLGESTVGHKRAIAILRSSNHAAQAAAFKADNADYQIPVVGAMGGTVSDGGGLCQGQYPPSRVRVGGCASLVQPHKAPRRKSECKSAIECSLMRALKCRRKPRTA
eukprot:1159614-Pelagomonas_calceolata.AAC.5